MITKGFVFALAILALCALAACKKSSQDKSSKVTMSQLLNDSEGQGLREIAITGWSEERLNKAVESFIQLYGQNGTSVATPAIRSEEGHYVLILPDDTEYDLFCFWVNHLVYSDKEQRFNDNVTGWFEVAPDAEGSWKPFANQTLMFFIPEADREFDNVFFLTEDERCFKQEFAYKAPLVPQESSFNVSRTSRAR